jgi:hypothetical protein
LDLGCLPGYPFSIRSLCGRFLGYPFSIRSLFGCFPGYPFSVRSLCGRFLGYPFSIRSLFGRFLGCLQLFRCRQKLTRSRVPESQFPAVPAQV